MQAILLQCSCLHIVSQTWPAASEERTAGPCPTQVKPQCTKGWPGAEPCKTLCAKRAGCLCHHLLLDGVWLVCKQVCCQIARILALQPAAACRQDAESLHAAECDGMPKQG